MGIFLKKMFPEASIKFVPCIGGEEDCSHLFLECPFAQEIWASQQIPQADASLAVACWGSLWGGIISRVGEPEWLLAMLWAIWLHCNEIIF